MKLAKMTISALALGLAMAAGCSQTQQAEVKPDQRTQLESGFLGNYSDLQPGQNNQALMLYIDPNVNWADYTKIMILPVTFWGDSNTKLSPADQQELCNDADKALHDQFSRDFTIVDQPGPGVLELKAAITDASAATPVLRSISMVVPQARVLNTLKYAATGSYAFVGGARGEAEITDSLTGQRLAAWVDERIGGGNISNAAQWDLGDAENVIDYWAKHLNDRVAQLQAQGATANASGALKSASAN